MVSLPSIPSSAFPGNSVHDFRRFNRPILCPEEYKPEPCSPAPEIFGCRQEVWPVYRGIGDLFTRLFEEFVFLGEVFCRFMREAALEVVNGNLIPLADIVERKSYLFPGLTGVVLLRMIQQLDQVPMDMISHHEKLDQLPIKLYGLRENLGALPASDISLLASLLIKKPHQRIEEAPENSADFFPLYDSLREITGSLMRCPAYRILFAEEFFAMKGELLKALDGRNRKVKAEAELLAGFAKRNQVMILSSPF